MLEGLAAIDWQNLKHGGGTAADVPDLLEALASPDRQVRQEALGSLYSNIYHQGSVYQATAYAVPFFLELLSDETVPDKDKIIVFLVDAAGAHFYPDVHSDVHEDLNSLETLHRDKISTSAFPTIVDEEDFWVEATYQAVVRGLPVYESLLTVSDPAVRAAAAYILAEVHAQAPTALAALWRQWEIESVPMTRASILLALGVMDGAAPHFLQVGEIVLQSNDSSGLRFAAAMALTRVMGAATPESALDLLVQAIRNPAPMGETYQQLPWSENGVVGDACANLSNIGWPRAARVIPLLIWALEEVNGLAALTIVETLLSIVFKEPAPKSSFRVDNLTPEQQQVLSGLAASKNAWCFAGNMIYILRAFGLPDNRDDLQAFLYSKGAAHD